MGIAEDRGWKEVGLDGAMGRWVHYEDCFGVLKATKVRFFRDGKPLSGPWLSFGLPDEPAPHGESGLLNAISSGRITYSQLSHGTLLDQDRHPVPYDSAELTCALRIHEDIYRVFAVRTEEECQSLRFRLVGKPLPNPRVQDIRVGGRYYYLDKRANGDVWLDVRVMTILDSQLTGRIFCELLAQDGDTIPITKLNFPRLTVTLSGQEGQQEETWREETDREEELLEKSVREEELLPYAEREGQTVNICWLGVKGAASYRVTLYRRVERRGYAPLYHLAEYETDRGTHFLSVTGLIGSGLLFRVAALDRAGEEIAQTRGISL